MSEGKWNGRTTEPNWRGRCLFHYDATSQNGCNKYLYCTNNSGLIGGRCTSQTSYTTAFAVLSRAAKPPTGPLIFFPFLILSSTLRVFCPKHSSRGSFLASAYSIPFPFVLIQLSPSFPFFNLEQRLSSRYWLNSFRSPIVEQNGAPTAY